MAKGRHPLVPAVAAPVPWFHHTRAHGKEFCWAIGCPELTQLLGIAACSCTLQVLRSKLQQTRPRSGGEWRGEARSQQGSGGHPK